MDKFIVKKRGEYIQVTYRIEEDLLEKIDKTVLDYNLTSRNSFINDCIRYALQNMEDEGRN